MKTILICYARTGSGHKSAADAISTGIQEEVSRLNLQDQFQTICEDVIAPSSYFHKLLEDSYNYLEQHNPAMMEYFFKFIEWLKPNKWQPGYLLCRKYALNLLRQHRPDVIVSVHPMINHFIKQAVDEEYLSIKPPLIVVLTDPNTQIWSGWACGGADLTLVPNELVKNKMLSFGLQENRIQIVGMPIASCFSRPCPKTRADVLTALNLRTDLPTVCLCAGQAGGGNIAKIYEQLSDCKRKIQAIVICGRNKKLYDTICSQAQHADIPTAVLHTADDMNALMNACELLITKPGGLTTFEAIARGLPIAFEMIDKLMPQEKGTAEMLLDCNAAQAIRCPSDIKAIIDSPQLSATVSNSLFAKHTFTKPNATQTIAQIIIDRCLQPQTKDDQICIAIKKN